LAAWLGRLSRKFKLGHHQNARIFGEPEDIFQIAIPSPLAPEFVTPLIGSRTSIRFALGKFHFANQYQLNLVFSFADCVSSRADGPLQYCKLVSHEL
jgi:hypothetical protein